MRHSPHHQGRPEVFLCSRRVQVPTSWSGLETASSPPAAERGGGAQTAAPPPAPRASILLVAAGPSLFGLLHTPHRLNFLHIAHERNVLLVSSCAPLPVPPEALGPSTPPTLWSREGCQNPSASLHAFPKKCPES
ncbi:UNVERIFIED_CONTAM: hypothetical protein K2H54_042093 [Gekko kuhli]